MIDMIELTHANLKTKVAVVKSLIFAYWYSDTHKATVVVASGGAMFPVLESVEEIKGKMSYVSAP